MSITPTSAPTKLYDESYKPINVSISGDRTLFALHRKPTSSTASSPKVVLLHGFPQTHTLFYTFAPALPEDFDLLIPDLPGYGRSSKSTSGDKRTWAKDIFELVDVVWGKDSKVIIAGHDRGARVAYRAATDSPERLVGVSVLDIVPGLRQFERIAHYSGPTDAETLRTATAPVINPEAFGSHHWILLALDSPIPEILINPSTAVAYITRLTNNWAGSRIAREGGFDKTALASWTNPASAHTDASITAVRGDFTAEDRISTYFEDYRAGAREDVLHDREFLEKDKKDRIKVPVQSLASAYLTKRYLNLEGLWKEWVAEDKWLEYQTIGDEETGHFFPIEASEESAKKLADWVEKVWRS